MAELKGSIGLNTRMGLAPTSVATSPQLSSTVSKPKTSFSAIDWKLKVALSMVIIAFVYATVIRLKKRKKTKAVVV